MLSMMIYISFCVRDKTGVFTCVAVNVLWRASKMSTITVFVKIILVVRFKIYTKNTLVFTEHFETGAVPISHASIPQPVAWRVMFS